MKIYSKLFSSIVFIALAYGANGQDAKASLKTLYSKYSSIPNYMVSVNYVAESEMMGFKNEQAGQLTVVGEKYILSFGPNETWLNDGKAEYIGTKEEDHSELIIFCPGENFEVPVNYGKLFTFYGGGLDASTEGGMIKVVPKDGSYKYALLTTSGGSLMKVTIVDEMDMSHTYTFSNFSTSTSGVQFTINPKEYAATIDERQGCK